MGKFLLHSSNCSYRWITVPGSLLLHPGCCAAWYLPRHLSGEEDLPHETCDSGLDMAGATVVAAMSFPTPRHPSPLSEPGSLSFHPNLGQQNSRRRETVHLLQRRPSVPLLFPNFHHIFFPHPPKDSPSAWLRGTTTGPDPRGPAAALRHLGSSKLWPLLAEWHLLRHQCSTWPMSAVT